MRYFLDISLLVLIVATILIHARKGFIKSVFGMAKTVLAMILTYFLGPVVSTWLADAWISDWATEFVNGRLLSLFESGAESFDLSSLVEKLPSWLNFLLEKMGVNAGELVGNLADQTMADSTALREFSATLAAPITGLISDLLGYASVFLLSLLTLGLLAFLLGKISQLPVLRQVDRVLGVVLGVCLALIYASVYTLLLYVVLNIVEGLNPNIAFQAAFESSYLFRWLYDINIFRWLFGIG